MITQEDLFQQRQRTLDNLFNKNTRTLLTQNNIALTADQEALYSTLVLDAYKANDKCIDILCCKKKSLDYPRTLWIINDIPYLTLAAPSAQKDKDKPRNIVSKRALPIAGGPILRDKVFRPKQLGMNAHLAWAQNEVQSLKILALVCYTIDRIVVGGIKTHVFMHEAPGKDLSEWVAEKVLTPLHVLTIFSKLCERTLALHARGHIHCDIKPGNIIFDPTTSALALVDWEARQPIGQITKNYTFSNKYGHPELRRLKSTREAIVCKAAYDVYGILSTMESLINKVLRYIPVSDTSADYLKALLLIIQEATYLSPLATHPEEENIAKGIDDLPSLSMVTEWANTQLRTFEAKQAMSGKNEAAEATTKEIELVRNTSTVRFFPPSDSVPAQRSGHTKCCIL